MAQKVKRMNHFSRLDTIMEATEREESVNGDCFHLELSQKSSNGRQSVERKNIHDVETSRRTGIVLPSTRICRSRQKRNTRPHSISSTEYLFVTKQDHNSEMTQKDNKNARDIRQVKLLFPEFFSSGASTSFVQQKDWHDVFQKNTTLVNEKVKEDPFIRPWLNLYGACSYT